MSSIDSWRPWRRIDVRLTALLIAVFSPIVAATLFLAHLYAAHELMEEIGRGLAAQGEGLAEAWALPPEESRRELEIRSRWLGAAGTAFWIVDESGETLLRGGPDLRRRRALAPGNSWNALRARPDDTIAHHRPLDHGHDLFLAVEARHFLKERRELWRGSWISLACGLAAAAAAALLATRVALRPLRRTTALLLDVDAAGLDLRVPERGTEDDLDRHARALNRVLDRLDAGFARLRAFSSDVAHELRTPINRMLNRAEIAALEAPQGSAEQEVLLELRSTAEELSRLVTSLLLLSQADDKRLALSYQRLAIPDLFESLRDLYEAVGHERDVELRFDAVDAEVSGDRTLLLRAVANLIDNAIRFAPPGSAVSVRASREGSEVGIEVEDRGPGIDAALRNVIFDRFVRLDRSKPGSGLGLAITRALVEVHGGRVAAAAGPLGGALVHIWLPVASGATGATG